MKRGLGLFIFFLTLTCFLPLCARAGEPGASPEQVQLLSDRFDGTRYFNPGRPEQPSPPPGRAVEIDPPAAEACVPEEFEKLCMNG